MNGKGGGSPCRWIRGSFLSLSVCHKYTRSCVSFTVLTFFNGGGKCVSFANYICKVNENRKG